MLYSKKVPNVPIIRNKYTLQVVLTDGDKMYHNVAFMQRENKYLEEMLDLRAKILLAEIIEFIREQENTND